MNTKHFVKTDEEIAIMREGCQILASVMGKLEKKMAVGVTGLEVDQLAESLIREAGCEPAFKGYGAESGDPFPATVCFSVNEGIVHGIPTERVIEDGDMIKIDIGLKHKGMFADMARSFLVGNVPEEAIALVEVTRKAFNKGVATIKNGSTLEEYARAVQEYAEGQGYHMVKNLVGHGIGHDLHEAPQIPNYVSKRMNNFTFKTGMTVAIEPMVNIGTEEVQIADDGWTFETADGSLSAHWENTILVTEKGSEILTKN
ncbi:MAG: type I methionyl aminopeptidase [Candidatus Moraniibacteriota bacterium]|nr:MAG: type I methionyl aminopeptidase [Candidatus Moranbacteria bacterium]